MKPDVRRFLMVSSGTFLMCALTLNGAQPKPKTDSADISFVEPIIGHVFDAKKKQIRAILGIPGAARVADAIALDAHIENVIMGASGGLAIGSVPDGDGSVLIRPVNSPPTVTPVAGSMKAFTAGAFSPSGRSAILFGPDCTCLQIAVGLADSPNVSRVIDATSLTGNITALAINDDASFAAVAASGLDDGSQAAQVFVIDLNSDAPPRVVLSSSATGLAFSPSGKNLAVVDARTHSLTLVQDVAGDAVALNIAGEPDGLTMPSAVAFVDAATVLIGDRAGQVHMVDVQAKQVKSITCICRPTAMESMALKATYRLTGTETGAVWILNLSDSEPAVRFVPVDSDDSEGTGSESAQ